VIRAARSLYINRRNREIVEGRIERSTEALLSYLGLAGISAARIGLFDVELSDEELKLTRLPAPDARQHGLAEAEVVGEGGNPFAQPDPFHDPYEIMARAQAGDLACPQCNQPLAAESVQIGGVPEARLACQEEACGYTSL